MYILTSSFRDLGVCANFGDHILALFICCRVNHLWMIVGIMMMMMMMMMMITIMMIFGCYRLSEGRALLLLVASLLLHSLANLGQDQQDEELHH